MCKIDIESSDLSLRHFSCNLYSPDSSVVSMITDEKGETVPSATTNIGNPWMLVMFNTGVQKESIFVHPQRLERISSSLSHQQRQNALIRAASSAYGYMLEPEKFVRSAYPYLTDAR